MNKFKHVISLGFFCSPAIELERIGLRDASYPFDWLISDFEGLIKCLDDDFKDFLKYENLVQHKNNKHYYLDKKYNFHFYHDFSAFQDLKTQFPSIMEKYNRRVDRFRTDIKEPTLFLRYIENDRELRFIENNYKRIISLLKKDNNENEIVFISNDNFNSDKISIYKVEKDENDIVSRNFLEKNSELKKLLCSEIYDTDKKLVNIRIYKKKKLRKAVLKYANFKSPKIQRLFKKPYTHDKTTER